MSKFEYTLPSGAKYIVNGPPGATKEQADRIFYEQVAAGSLVGYIPGQTLTSLSVAITKFELSRLDRGTAGVDTATVLSVVNGLPIVAGLPNLIDVPLQNPINQADLATVNQNVLGLPGSIGSDAVGPLDAAQTQALLAQIANLVDQPYDQISYEKGLGKYGFTTLKLEEAGYVKPGTVLRFLAIDPEDFTSVMSSPGIWTGKDGITSLDALLADPEQQTLIQTQLMKNSYQSLQASGAITAPATLAATLATGYIYAQGALQTATNLTSLVSNLGLKLGNDGVLRVTNDIQTTIANLLNSPSNLANLDISSIASGAVNSLTTGLNQLTNLNISNLTANITNTINGGVGSLIANASKFGTEITTAWSSGNLGSLLNVGNLGSLTGNLDIFGKMSEYAVNFTNPLSSFNLSSLNIGNLSNLNLGSLGLGNLNLSSLGNLGSLNLGSLANLGNLNLGSLTNLAGLGNIGNLLGGLGNLGSIGSIFGGGGSSLVSATQFAGGFTNTVNRATVDSAVTRILGNAKIPSPTFEFPSANSLLAGLDVAQAKNILAGITNSSSLLTNNQGFGLSNNQISGIGGTVNTFNRLLG
jgi:hypothetical protein